MPLKGICNGCGCCCLIRDPRTKELLHCMNLMLNEGAKYGEPGATFCSAYHSRVANMPVYLVDDEGNWRGHTICAGDGSEEELNDFIDKGLLEKGSPCSLKLEDR